MSRCAHKCKILLSSLFRALCLLFSACGYHFTAASHLPVCVPPILSDRTGTLTSAIINELSSAYPLTYGGVDAPYELIVEIAYDQKEDIGYQYQTKGVSGTLQDKLSAVEGRQILKAKVSVRSKNSDHTLFGPIEVETQLEYDYSDNKSFSDLAFISPTGQVETYLNLSLGQLDSEEDASIIAKERVYRELAKKIVKTANFAQSVSVK